MIREICGLDFGWAVKSVESVEEIILKNPPRSPFKKGGLSFDSKDFPPFVKGGVRGDFEGSFGYTIVIPDESA